MKNATKHADDLKALFKRLLKDGKPAPLVKQEPLKALVRAAMSFDVTDHRADDAMKMIEREFVDLNELRVATDLEIAELLGNRYPAIEKRVEMITRALNAIFEKEHTLNLDRLATIGKKEVRQFLRDLPELHPFVEAYVMLMAFEVAAVPVDDETLAFLREEEVIEEKATFGDAQKFLEHHLKAEECYEFFAVVRRAIHSDSGKKKAKAKA